MPNDSTPKKKWSHKKKVGYGLLTLILLCVVAELGLRMLGAIFRPDVDKSARNIDDCGSLVFLAVGDSMTFGMGAKRAEAYPMQMIPFLEQAYPGVNIKAYNMAVPGTNSSEGLKNLDEFFEKNPSAAIDFAIVLYGVNNRWNLHAATFWQWDKTAKRDHLAAYLASKFQINKAVSVATQGSRAAVEAVTDEQREAAEERTDYRKILRETDWDVFFPGFRDDLLVRWIKHDYWKFQTELSERDISPIWLTYFSPRFEHLNPLIIETVGELNEPVFDLEKPADYYALREFFAQDRFHMKAAGYRDVAKRITAEFVRLYPPESIKEKLEKKRMRPICRSRARD